MVLAGFVCLPEGKARFVKVAYIALAVQILRLLTEQI
jgi:hypothetical protein